MTVVQWTYYIGIICRDVIYNLKKLNIAGCFVSCCLDVDLYSMGRLCIGSVL